MYLDENKLVHLFHSNSSYYPAIGKHAPTKYYQATSISKNYPAHPFDLQPETDCKTRFPSIGSIREYSKCPMQKSTMFTILQNSFCVRNAHSTTPSAGALLPIELYLVLLNVDQAEAGYYHYHREMQSLTYIKEVHGDLPFLTPVNQFAKSASFLIIMTGNLTSMILKYGARAYRYALLECGHIGQNVSLNSELCDAGSCAIGGFHDDLLSETLNLGPDEFPLYLYSVGIKSSE
ncbi:SagB-type dehydrogenase family enzyme [Tumebacillus sp. BK434]|uniref:SagB/ThcOx family dehydrogenase n=1 Tax=Tumebacillus sp. BK434 TaxID=2512169 RepID=UPI0010502BF7|nr:SagB/ThcOx family dehydrogenase [Tumebacillus sp. BK434]TCP57890.1 SagB-type dehydrogenase family enzyme [Tumebacillus sp. BK434]